MGWLDPIKHAAGTVIHFAGDAADTTFNLARYAGKKIEDDVPGAKTVAKVLVKVEDDLSPHSKQKLPDRYQAIINYGNANKDPIDLDANAAQAKTMTPTQFIDAVRPYDADKHYGKWDYKNDPTLVKGGTDPKDKDNPDAIGPGGYSRNDLARFGNYNFGYVAHAKGIPLTATLEGAGIVQAAVQNKGKDPLSDLGAVLGLTSGIAATGPLGPLLDWGAVGAASLGFTWGDNPDDTKDIIAGWRNSHRA